MTKGLIFKYSADPYDPLMRDKLGTTSVCGLGLRDPDFWSNDNPVWAICGPYHRKQLNHGDIVFFVPKKAAIMEARLKDYVCTGILAVANKLPCREEVEVDHRLTPLYKERYEKDLDAHLKKDNERTKKIRPCNFVVGDSSKSKWFGRNKRYLSKLLQELNLQSVTRKLSIRRIPDLDEEQARNLYKELVGKEL